MKRILVIIVSLLLTQLSYSQSFIQEKKYNGDPLYDFITEWWKTPYRYGGTTKKGIDCSAFTGKLFQSVYRVSLPRTASQQYRTTKRINKSQLRDGDLVFFRTKVKSGWHVGVYLTDGWFVHSKSKSGVTFSNLSDATYQKLFYAAGRILK